MSSNWILWVIVGFFCCMSHVGYAGDIETEAKEAFGEGRKLFEKEQYAEAANQFRKANELKPNWKILYNIGQCEAAARHYGLAIELFQEYLALGGDSVSMERRDEILEEVKRLQLMVGYFEIQGGPEGAEVSVDGVKRGVLPLSGSVAVSSGLDHTIAVTFADSVVYERVLKLLSGQTKVLNIDKSTNDDDGSDKSSVESGAIGGDGSPITSDQREMSETSSGKSLDKARPLKVMGITSLSIGTAALVGWGVVGGMSLKLHSDLKEDCEPNGCPADMSEDQGRLDTLSTTTSVLLGVGVGFATLGVVLLAIHKKKEKETMVTGTPVVTPEFAGAAVVGRF